ncbi:MAG TPA: hypothetical protein VK533_03020 [Sphingomonas sp.]|uniref:hypothetical protein n=1 Tax=Sphingomonas sp. TaxID=28214 RepID=UPI002BD8D95D|nr:hypothetical protein [Sphingomonas sp.]HMI18495.1 hypothetical protein [Sphingomonas sp.]
MFNERARFRLHHPAGTIPALAEAPPGAPRADLAERAIAAFARAPANVAAGPVWDALLAGPQKHLVRWLARGEAEPLAADLAALGRSEAAQGFFGGAGQHRRCAGDSAYAQLLAAWTHDKLLSLAEAVGAVRLELPENGAWGETIAIPPADLFAAIEIKLGCDLSPPTHVGAFLGIDAGGRVLQMRVLEAIHAAWRLKQIADAHGFGRVCEIGAGAGLTAYYAALLGIEDYTIIDLPTMNAVQAYMLAGSRIGDRVALPGEGRDGAIRVLPHSAFAGLARGSIDILYNQDSLPEIERGAASAYLADARRIGVPLLLSINQEAHLPTADGRQASVPELIAETGGFTLLSRHRHWLRQGYAEEIYRAKGGEE